MAYSLCDANGYLSHGPTIKGWQLVKELSHSVAGLRPALDELENHGYTNKLISLALECRTLSSKTSNPDIKSTLANISSCAGRAEEILALSHVLG